MRVVVVGAGVIGASVAYHLARRGAHVWCVDGAQTPGTGVTAVGFATATAYRRFPKAYFDLNRAGIAEYALLAEILAPSAWWHRTGTVAWSDDESFAGYLDQLAEWGCAVERHDGRTAGSLGDLVEFPRSGLVAVLPEEGWIDAVAFTRLLLDKAVEAGATLVLGARVVSVPRHDGRVAGVGLEDGQWLPADVVVNAAGSAADEIGAQAGARAFLGAPRRSLIAHLRVGRDPLRHILRTPDVSIRPDGPGRVVARSDQVDRDLPAGCDTPVPEHLKDLLERVARAVPLLDTGTVEDARVVQARCARDGLPSVGELSAVPGYHEAVANAGVTLAPVFGRALAAQILDGQREALVAPFSPDRFTNGSETGKPPS